MDIQKYCKTCGKKISDYEYNYHDAKCFSCCEQDYLDKLAEQLQNNEETETFREDKVICPYCGYVFEDDDSYFLNEGGGEFECEECGNTFNFTAHVEITYSTKRQND